VNKVQRVSPLRAAVSAARKDKKNIAFVPTMGNLHDGHLELVKMAKRHADFIVVSIYVNPTQFGEDEDFDNYPSTLEEDARQLAELGADLLFLPVQEIMYPSGLTAPTEVIVPDIGKMYCGQDRPVHFNGVTTVVSRLFNMVQPDVAVFGKKDYQQLTIIRRMVVDLAYPIEIVGVDTVRSEHGLALSSRNGYLSKKQLATAPVLQQTLQELAASLQQSNNDIAQLEKDVWQKLETAGFAPQYVRVCNQADLQPATQDDTELVILAAASLGKTRLIDNVEVSLDEGG